MAVLKIMAKNDKTHQKCQFTMDEPFATNNCAWISQHLKSKSMLAKMVKAVQALIKPMSAPLKIPTGSFTDIHGFTTSTNAMDAPVIIHKA